TNFVGAQLGYSDLSGAPSAANPTAQVGLSAVNGSSTNYMRADAAPALSQSISPVWTGTHTFNVAPIVSVTDGATNSASTLLTLTHSSISPVTTGFGSYLLFRLKNGSGSVVDAGGLQIAWDSSVNSANLTVMLANNGSAPAKFATFSAYGGLSVGTTSGPVANGIIDATTGFTVNGVTPGNGYFLQSDLAKYAASSWSLPTSGGTTGQVLMASGSTAAVWGGGAVWDGVAAVSGSDATTTSTSFVDITGLATASLSPGAKYEIEVMLDVGTSADANGTQYAIHAGPGASMYVFTQGTTNSATAITTVVGNAFDAALGNQTWLTSASVSGMIFIRGFVNTGSSITVRHRKVTSGTSTVRVGSYIKWRKTP